jgi:hypothetical protein
MVESGDCQHANAIEPNAEQYGSPTEVYKTQRDDADMHSNKWNTTRPIYVKLFLVIHDAKVKAGEMQEAKRITEAIVLRKGDPWQAE